MYVVYGYGVVFYYEAVCGVRVGVGEDPGFEVVAAGSECAVIECDGAVVELAGELFGLDVAACVGYYDGRDTHCGTSLCLWPSRILLSSR